VPRFRDLLGAPLRTCSFPIPGASKEKIIFRASGLLIPSAALPASPKTAQWHGSPPRGWKNKLDNLSFHWSCPGAYKHLQVPRQPACLNVRSSRDTHGRTHSFFFIYFLNEKRLLWSKNWKVLISNLNRCSFFIKFKSQLLTFWRVNLKFLYQKVSILNFIFMVKLEINFQMKAGTLQCYSLNNNLHLKMNQIRGILSFIFPIILFLFKLFLKFKIFFMKLFVLFIFMIIKFLFWKIIGMIIYFPKYLISKIFLVSKIKENKSRKFQRLFIEIIIIFLIIHLIHNWVKLFWIKFFYSQNQQFLNKSINKQEKSLFVWIIYLYLLFKFDFSPIIELKKKSSDELKWKVNLKNQM
jgi:hypothetical protein